LFRVEQKYVLCAYFCFTSFIFFRPGLKQIILIIHSSAEQVRAVSDLIHVRPSPATTTSNYLDVYTHNTILLLLLLLLYYYIFNNAVRVVWSQSISSTIVKRAFIYYYYYYLLLYSRWCGTHARTIIIITHLYTYIYVYTQHYVPI